MPDQRNKPFSRKLKDNYSAVMSTVAVVIALTSAGAIASGVVVTSKSIKNGAILSQDIHRSAVKSSDIGNNAVGSTDIGTGSVESSDIGTGQVDSSDIGTGQVTPQDVTMPDPMQLKDVDSTTITPTLSFTLLDSVGSYVKVDPASTLEVDWTGSVFGENGGKVSGCVFQLRVDGQPSPMGGGEVFGTGLTSVAATALFPAVGAGLHQIQIWARIVVDTPAANQCTVGPAAAGINQTFVISEQVI